MASQSDEPRRRRWFQVAAVAAPYTAVWATLAFLVPGHWLGFKDGYFYQLFIKTYQLEWIPTDYNSHDIPGYPIYGFYLVARLGDLLGLTDPSRSYLLLLIIGSGLTVVVGYWLLRPITGHRGGLFTVAAMIVWPFVLDVVHMYQRPHELFALIAGVGFVLRIALRPLRPSDRRGNAALGLLAGFLCGEYLPVMVPAFAAALPMLVRKFWLLPPGERWRELRTLIFIGIVALSVALPQLVLLAAGLLSHHSLPNPEVFFAQEFGLPYWIPIWALAALLLATAALVRRSSAAWEIVPGPLGVFALYAVLCLAAAMGMPYPVANIVPSFAGLLWLAGCCLAVQRLPWSIPRLALPPVGIAALTLIVLRLYSGGAPEDFVPTTLLSDARVKDHHLQAVVQTIDETPAISRLLANHEYRFVQYYTRRTVFMTLPFNEGYVSRYDNFPGKVASLKIAAHDGGTAALRQWLDETSTDTIVLDGLSDSDATFDIDLLTIAGYPRSGTVVTHVAVEKSAVLALVGNGGWRQLHPDCDCLVLTRR